MYTKRPRKIRITLLTRAREEIGKRPRASTRWRVRSDADRLVETLARCGENGKQRREWRCLLSGLEPARLKISLPGPSDHRVRARDDGYRSWNRHYKGRLLARNLPVEYEPLSDRAAHESRSSSRIGRSLSSVFQNLKAARDSLRGFLRFCPNFMHTLHDINRISCGFA